MVGSHFLPVRAFAGPEQVQAAVSDLDGSVKNVDMRVLVADLVRIFGFEQRLIEKTLLPGAYKCSELVYIRLLADKTGQTPEKITEANPARDWSSVLKQAGIEEKLLIEQLEKTYSDIAFALLNLPAKKRTDKRVEFKGR